MEREKDSSLTDSTEQVSKQELNAWKRGFTPQAEIWNGRMATIGLIIGVLTLLITNFLF